MASVSSPSLLERKGRELGLAVDSPPMALTQALNDEDFLRAAGVDCCTRTRGAAVSAERAAARGAPESASKAFTLMANALLARGKLPDAVAMLQHEADIASRLGAEMQDCAPAKQETLEKCLVRPEQEHIHQSRETCRNELFDLFGIFIGSTLDVAKALDAAVKKGRKRGRQAIEGAQDDLERLKSQVDAIESVLRKEARRILIHKLNEDSIQISPRGQTPYPDGCWISLRGAEAFHGADSPNPVRKAFADLIRQLHQRSFGQRPQTAARDRLSLEFPDTLWSAQWRHLGRSVAASSARTAHQRAGAAPSHGTPAQETPKWPNEKRMGHLSCKSAYAYILSSPPRP